MIKGKRVNLRLITEQDIDHIHNLQTDVSEKGEFSNPGFMSIVHLKKRFQEHGMSEKDNGVLLITDKSDTIVGMVQHFKGVKYSTGFELGAVIYKKEHRQKGYVTEAIQLFTAYLFETHPIERLELATFTENIGAQMVAEKCGFTYEGINRKCCYIKGVASDLKRYSILRHEVPSLSSLLEKA